MAKMTRSAIHHPVMANEASKMRMERTSISMMKKILPVGGGGGGGKYIIIVLSRIDLL